MRPVRRRFAHSIVALTSIVCASLLAAGCSADPSNPNTTESPQGHETIGAGGGVLDVNGVKLTVPAGAVSTNVEFTVTTSSETAPDGYVADSAIYVFGPEGLTFAVPLTIEIPFTGDGKDAHVLWSTRDGKGFEIVESTIGAGKATAQVSHFSRGFVGRRKALGQNPDASDAADAAATLDANDAGTTDSCSCGASLTCCGSVCVNTKTSAANCGSCFMACGAGESCVNGGCLHCAAASQSCVATAVQCCPGTVCSSGVCQPVVP
jgi:hypothetical protein